MKKWSTKIKRTETHITLAKLRIYQEKDWFGMFDLAGLIWRDKQTNQPAFSTTNIRKVCECVCVSVYSKRIFKIRTIKVSFLLLLFFIYFCNISLALRHNLSMCCWLFAIIQTLNPFHSFTQLLEKAKIDLFALSIVKCYTTFSFSTLLYRFATRMFDSCFNGKSW